MSTEENPARMLYTQLWSYMRGNVAYVSLDFNFGNDEDAASYGWRLSLALDQLEDGPLKEWV